MDTNPFSIESILKKGSSGSVTEAVKETEPSKSTEALSLAVKLAGKFLTLDRPRSLKKKYFHTYSVQCQWYEDQCNDVLERWELRSFKGIYNSRASMYDSLYYT